MSQEKQEMELNADEQAWLEEYRRALEEKYPGLIEDLVIFRSEDASYYLPDYALNTIVILKECNRQTRKEIHRLGYRTAGLSEAMPFIWVYTQNEWEQRRCDGMLPYMGDGTPAWSNHS